MGLFSFIPSIAHIMLPHVLDEVDLFEALWSGWTWEGSASKNTFYSRQIKTNVIHWDPFGAVKDHNMPLTTVNRETEPDQEHYSVAWCSHHHHPKGHKMSPYSKLKWNYSSSSVIIYQNTSQAKAVIDFSSTALKREENMSKPNLFLGGVLSCVICDSCCYTIPA